jgi:hypothetical protein
MKKKPSSLTGEGFSLGLAPIYGAARPFARTLKWEERNKMVVYQPQKWYWTNEVFVEKGEPARRRLRSGNRRGAHSRT